MPYAAPRPCIDCRTLIATGSRCPRCAKARESQDVAYRGTSTERGHDSRWRALRQRYVAAHPWCEECLARGRRVDVHEVHHKTPHRGDDALRLAWGNLQSLCAHHHGLTKREPGYRAPARRGA